MYGYRYEEECAARVSAKVRTNILGRKHGVRDLVVFVHQALPDVEYENECYQDKEKRSGIVSKANGSSCSHGFPPVR